MRIPKYNLRIAAYATCGSAVELAHIANMSSAKLSRIMTGTVEATPAERARLAEALGVDEQWLFSTRIEMPKFKPGQERVAITLAEMATR